jgi:putative PIN family toxin of toxin-antitoxin system
VRVVLDTSVLVAAIRSTDGASGVLVQAVLMGSLRPLVSVPLVLEYEAVLTRPEHLAVSGLAAEGAMVIVKAFCKMGEPVHLAHRLRPQLQDPNDEFVLETAFYGNAEAIVTFNEKDFQPAATSLGIETVSPGKALERMRKP